LANGNRETKSAPARKRRAFVAEAVAPACRKCAGTTFHKGFVGAFGGEPELYVYECTKCARMDVWQWAGQDWQMQRPRRYAGTEY
jgi:hypothetical protein